MKRHPALEPFSRDHNDGLILARRLDIDGAPAIALFRQAWDAELRDHFDEEERLLGPLLASADLERLLQEHALIADLGAHARTDEEARRLGMLLHDHIRWEERVLFVTVERESGEASLRSLAQATALIERRRGLANPLRKELVSRRPGLPSEPQLIDLAYLVATAQDLGPQWGLESEDLNSTLLTWTEGHGIEEHVNDEVDVLVVVLEGEMLVTLGDETHLLRTGSLILIPKGTRRSLRATSPRAAHLNVHRRRKKLDPLAASPRRSE